MYDIFHSAVLTYTFKTKSVCEVGGSINVIITDDDDDNAIWLIYDDGWWMYNVWWWSMMDVGFMTSIMIDDRFDVWCMTDDKWCMIFDDDRW